MSFDIEAMHEMRDTYQLLTEEEKKALTERGQEGVRKYNRWQQFQKEYKAKQLAMSPEEKEARRMERAALKAKEEKEALNKIMTNFVVAQLVEGTDQIGMAIQTVLAYPDVCKEVAQIMNPRDFLFQHVDDNSVTLLQKNGEEWIESPLKYSTLKETRVVNVRQNGKMIETEQFRWKITVQREIGRDLLGNPIHELFNEWKFLANSPFAGQEKHFSTNAPSLSDFLNQCREENGGLFW